MPDSAGNQGQSLIEKHAQLVVAAELLKENYAQWRNGIRQSTCYASSKQAFDVFSNVLLGILDIGL